MKRHSRILFEVIFTHGANNHVPFASEEFLVSKSVAQNLRGMPLKMFSSKSDSSSSEESF